ncbi:hypothetical protein BPNPMPFG_002508 [Mesorhizobium sp. AR07]|uniref:hypothetical protein n=1 Tax=Mesorhizobium sp. AR07 TaxID=2865838 RepID=UPI00215F4D5C|nr:hypothetical protein [Mesorhizobium sp. AR07]UVK46798.1 hypothetical protein BPNPMPFG_002508 [Mesorhizobium sp. AR07]
MEFISQYWPQLVMFGLCVIWSVRLEGRVNTSEKDITRLDKQRSDDLKDAKEARQATGEKLDRMDDKIERNFQEIRNSISAIYQQGVPK